MANRKLQYNDIYAKMNDLINGSFQKNGSHSYACGVLQSTVVNILTHDLPKHKQLEVLKTLETIFNKE